MVRKHEPGRLLGARLNEPHGREPFQADLTDSSPYRYLRKRLYVPYAMKSAGPKLILALVSLLSALLAAELLLRTAAPPDFLQAPTLNTEWIVEDAILAWRTKPDFWSRAFSTNSLGFRGPEVREVKTIPRIVCLGDSGTFGVGIDEQTKRHFHGYPMELATLAQRGGRLAAEVINAGVLGYTSSHGLRQLATQIVELEPDILTVRFGANDHRRSWSPHQRVEEPVNPLARALLYRFSHWKLTHLTLTVYRRIPAFHSPRGTIWVSLDRFKANLRRFAEIGRKEGIRVLFIDTPVDPSPRGKHPHREKILRMSGYRTFGGFRQQHERYQAALRAMARKEGVPLLSTRSRFRSRKDPLFSEADFVHPNEKGAKELARMLWDRLLELGWVTEEQPTRLREEDDPSQGSRLHSSLSRTIRSSAHAADTPRPLREVQNWSSPISPRMDRSGTRIGPPGIATGCASE